MTSGPTSPPDPTGDATAPPQAEWQFDDVGSRDGDVNAFVVDVDGFEGPLDLLLAMARTHKIDLPRISVLALAEQYLKFIDEAQEVRLELAADYLVMAAWLAYLKSKLLLPREDNEDEHASAEEMAQRLSFRLMRLDAMRRASAELMNRHRLGRDVFARGRPESIKRVRETTYTALIYDLLKAYADQRQRTIKIVHTVKKRTVWSVKYARTRLQTLIGDLQETWVQLDFYIERYLPTPEDTRTVRASSFGASLEMAREGLLELRQDAPFSPIYMRRREAQEVPPSHSEALGSDPGDQNDAHNQDPEGDAP